MPTHNNQNTANCTRVTSSPISAFCVLARKCCSSRRRALYDAMADTKNVNAINDLYNN